MSFGEGPELEYIMDVKTVRLSGNTLGYKVRASYDNQHGAMDARADAVAAEYLAKARGADAEAALRASQNDSAGARREDEDWSRYPADPMRPPGPLERKLRAHPAPIGLCFGTYCEASQGVHDLARKVAETLAEDRGHELGVAKERQLGVFLQRIRCNWGIAAIRAKARSREMRQPLVGCSREQAIRMLAGSCVPARPRRAPGQGQLDMLDALAWVEDTGAQMSREARAAA